MSVEAAYSKNISKILAIAGAQGDRRKLGVNERVEVATGAMRGGDVSATPIGSWVGGNHDAHT